jgi:hypothetical protein
MSLLTLDKITDIFCIADDFCKEYATEAQKSELLVDDGRRHRKRSCAMSDSEIITILVLFHFGTFHNFKHYYLFGVGKPLRKEFPTQLSYNRFIEIEHRVAIPLMLFIKLICFGECTGITFVDSTKIAVCHNKRIRNNKVFKNVAEIGKSTMGWFYGFKLHLMCNEKGDLLNFCLTKGNVDDRDERVFGVLSQNIFGKLYADKGYISAKLCEMLFNDGIHLVTGIRSNMKNKLMSMRDKILLRKRSVIETINDELKNICQVEHSRHRSVTNFLMNLLGAIVAYSFFEKKPSINFEMEETSGQLSLF